MKWVDSIFDVIQTFLAALGLSVGDGIGGVLLALLISGIIGPVVGRYYASEYQKKKFGEGTDTPAHEIVSRSKSLFWQVTGITVFVLTATLSLIIG